LPGAPARIRTRGIASYGSFLGCLAWSRCTHPVQPTRRMTPAPSPVRGRLARAPLGHRPFLPCLRRRAGTAAPSGVGGGLPSLPFRLQGGSTIPPCPPASPLPAWFGTFAGTTPISDSPAASLSGLRPRAFPDRPQRGQEPTGSRWGLPVLAHRASARARVFDSVGPDRRSRLARRPVWPSQQLNAVSAPGHNVISQLHGWPARTPVHASPAASPPPTQDAGP